MITVLPDVVLPASVIASGISGKQIRKNHRTENQGGYTTVNVVWQRTLRQYELGIIPMRLKQWQDLEAVHEVTDGGAYGFLMADPKDYSAVGQPLQPLQIGASAGAAGAGYGVQTYQLAREYVVAGSSLSRLRRITRPNGLPVLRRSGSTITIGVNPGNASVDVSTGVVTFVPDAARSVTSLTVGSTTQFGVATALPGLVVGERVFLQGLTGVDASALNGKSHEVTAIIGKTYTVSTNTAGMAITASGSAETYAQADETLTWSGEFYVPVHFMSDEIDWTILACGDFDERIIQAPSVTLIEVRE